MDILCRETNIKCIPRMKPLMKLEERRFAKAIARLVACNHFLPERIDLEREALGSAFVEGPLGRRLMARWLPQGNVISAITGK